jgi:NAD(P)-dependent dehydrogenase (short-subunit alcohol dehydrogenase family)
MTDELSGKVAVVTGGGRGVGRAYALRLAAQGAKVVVNDLGDASSSPAGDVVAEIEQAGGQALANGDSVADFGGAERIMQAAVERFGGLDILIANAGVIRPTYLADAKASDWDDVLGVHATGTFYCIHHAIPRMLARGGGSIVTTGDIATEVWFPRISSYRAAKAAIVILTQHAANELRDQNINVNAVMPGATETRMAATFLTSLDDRLDGFAAAAGRRYGAGEDSAQPAPPETVPPVGVYLCSDEARHITGRLFQMSGNSIGVVVPSAEVTFVAPDDKRWTTEDLRARVPELLDGKPSLLQD